MATGLSSPHLLLASSNVARMIKNLSHLLDASEVAKLTAEIDRNVVLLYRLGEEHFEFSRKLTDKDWRQKVSRLYYGVYNVRRSVVLKDSGGFSTDSSDHQKVDLIPDGIENKQAHMAKLKSLREDRNLADYSHFAEISDLIMTPSEASEFAVLFISDCNAFLTKNGVVL